MTLEDIVLNREFGPELFAHVKWYCTPPHTHTLRGERQFRSELVEMGEREPGGEKGCGCQRGALPWALLNVSLFTRVTIGAPKWLWWHHWLWRLTSDPVWLSRTEGLSSCPRLALSLQFYPTLSPHLLFFPGEILPPFFPPTPKEAVLNQSSLENWPWRIWSHGRSTWQLRRI